MKKTTMALAALAASHVFAQAPRAADPADPGAQVPALKYDSAFRGYRGLREGKPAPWREVNDEVEKRGGHMGHLRSLEKTDASAPTPAPTTTTTTQPRPAAPAQPPAAHKH